MLHDVDGVRLNVLDEGAGPVILFLHGLGGCWRDWEPQLESLRDRYRVVVIEHRGHGRSDRVPGPYSIERFAADALGVCRGLGIEHAYVVGLSMGGMIAQRLALLAPELVDALVLCDTFTHMGRQAADYLAQAADLVRAQGFGPLRDLMPPEITGWSTVTMAERPWVVRNNLREADGNDPDCWAWSVEALLAHDTSDEVGKIRAPVLVVWGAEDAGVPPKLAQPLADALGGAPVVVLQGAGHVCNLEQPAAFDRAITAFFAANPPREA
jgi:pimeloyl-ACP methyl ester carboxylesterase